MANLMPKRRLENIGLGITGFCVALVALVVVTLIFMVAQQGLTTFFVDGLNPIDFFFGQNWIPEQERYGALPMIVGSFAVTLLSTLFALPVALGSAIFVVEVAPAFGRRVFQPFIELLVGIPSVVYGVLGLYVVNSLVKTVFGEAAPTEPAVSAKGRRVLVIGGGDTGSDCVGTSIRQGALSVTQIEIMPQPPVGNNPQTPWPMWPAVLKTTSSHEEGCQRRWGLASRRFLVRDGRVRGVEVEEVTWDKSSADARPEMHSTGRMEVIEADLVLLAMGFLRPEGVPTGQGVFAAGDAVMGPSFVVRALADGRRVARDVDAYLGSLGTPADCDPADAADSPHPAHA